MMLRRSFFLLPLVFLILLCLPQAFGELSTDKQIYDLTEFKDTQIVVTGNIEVFQKSVRTYLILTHPDGISEEIDLKIFEKGPFKQVIQINNDWDLGTYTIVGMQGEKQLGTAKFELKISDFRINMKTKTVTPTPVVAQKKTFDFVDPNKDPQSYINRYNNEPTYKEWFDKNFPGYTIYDAVGLEAPKKIPEWVKNIALWYGQGQVSEDEFLNAISYLFNNGILKIKPNEVKSDIIEKTIPEQTIEPIKEQPKETTVIKNEPKSDPNIMTNKEFQAVFSDPDAYKGKWVKLTGEISQKITAKGEIDYVFGIGADSFALDKRVWAITQNTSLDLKERDCYELEGKILGGATAQLLLTGAEREIPAFGIEKNRKISCLEAKYPAFYTIKFDASQTQGNMKVTVKTIELAEDHARAYIEVENLGTSTINFNYMDALIIQDKRQYKMSYLFGEDYDQIDYSIVGGIIEDGYVIFDPIQPKPFKLILKGYELSNTYHNYEFEFNVDVK